MHWGGAEFGLVVIKKIATNTFCFAQKNKLHALEDMKVRLFLSLGRVKKKTISWKQI